MLQQESDARILRGIFKDYILQNPVNRTLMLPIIVVMAIAKYLEVLGASQTKQISEMIRSGTNSLTMLLSYSVVCLVGILLVEMQSFVICRAGQVGYRMSNRDTYRYFLSLEPREFNSVGKGEMQSTISRKSQAVQDMIDVFTLNFFPTLLTIFFASLEISKGLGFMVVVIVNASIVAYMVVTIRITTWRNRMRKQLISAQNRASDLLMDGLHNYEVIFTHNSEDSEIGKYNQSLRTIEKHSTDISKSLYLLNLAQKSIWCCMSIFIVFFACYSAGQRMTADKFAFLIYITSVVTKSLDNFGFMYGKFQAAMINARLTSLETRKRNSEGYRTAYRLSNQILVSSLELDFCEKSVFKNISFTVNKGEKVAIIGRNGSGKSSLIKSLVKLEDARGSIEIDGININDMTDPSFKGLISYIPQNPVLFDDTVMQNIKYGNAKVFDEEVYKASRDLGIHDSIVRLRNGYSTRVGEQGKLLSGGERQKILILRALIRESPILIMDEATASLDKHSEQKIFESIMEKDELTVIAIVHNLELLNMFSKILLIDNGSLVEIRDRSAINTELWSPCNFK